MPKRTCLFGVLRRESRSIRKELWNLFNVLAVERPFISSGLLLKPYGTLEEHSQQNRTPHSRSHKLLSRRSVDEHIKHKPDGLFAKVVHMAGIGKHASGKKSLSVRHGQILPGVAPSQQSVFLLLEKVLLLVRESLDSNQADYSKSEDDVQLGNWFIQLLVLVRIPNKVEGQSGPEEKQDLVDADES